MQYIDRFVIANSNCYIFLSTITPANGCVHELDKWLFQLVDRKALKPKWDLPSKSEIYLLSRILDIRKLNNNLLIKGTFWVPEGTVYPIQAWYNPILIGVFFVALYLGYSPKGTQLFPLNWSSPEFSGFMSGQCITPTTCSCFQGCSEDVVQHHRPWGDSTFVNSNRSDLVQFQHLPAGHIGDVINLMKIWNVEDLSLADLWRHFVCLLLFQIHIPLYCIHHV